MNAALLHRQQVVWPILLTCMGYAMFNVSDATVKALAFKFSMPQIIFLNSVVVIVVTSLYGIWKEGKRAFTTQKPKLMLLRALLVQIVIACNVAAFPYVELTTFYTLIFTSPFWVALFSILMGMEKFDKRRMAAILGGLSIIIIVFEPWTGDMNIWMLLVLVSALAYSMQLIVIRKIGQEESRIFMIVLGAIISLFIFGPFMMQNMIMPTLHEWGLFLLAGSIIGIGFIGIAYAMQVASSPSIVVPYHYTQIIWGALLGYILFGEIPTTAVIVGSIGIIGIGLYLLYSETRRKKELPPIEGEWV